MSKLRGLVWVGLATAIAAVAAVGLPRIARHVPWGVERALGRMASGPTAAGLCGADAPPASVAALRQLVSRLYPLDAQDRQLPITIDVARGSAVNAYATLGGHIYVFEGLVQQAQSPEELAAVLAHEVEHVRARHIIQGVVVNLVTFSGLKSVFPGTSSDSANAAQVLLSLKFSREQEDEADRRGLERLRKARIDAAGFVAFFARLERASDPPAILSNHPSTQSRAALASGYGGYLTAPILRADEWLALKQICRRAGDAG